MDDEGLVARRARRRAKLGEAGADARLDAVAARALRGEEAGQEVAVEPRRRAGTVGPVLARIDVERRIGGDGVGLVDDRRIDPAQQEVRAPFVGGAEGDAVDRRQVGGGRCASGRRRPSSRR
jgi:hypothetical protein